MFKMKMRKAIKTPKNKQKVKKTPRNSHKNHKKVLYNTTSNAIIEPKNGNLIRFCGTIELFVENESESNEPTLADATKGSSFHIKGVLQSNTELQKYEESKKLNNEDKVVDSTINKTEVNNTSKKTPQAPYAKVSDYIVYGADVVDAANYIIQLFYKTKPQYNCNRTKIEKLLAIADLVFMSQNETLFPEEIRINTCGVGVPILANYLLSDIIDSNTIEDCNSISESQIDDALHYPPIYNTRNELSEFVKTLLKNVFLAFGNYSARKIGECFDDFKHLIATKKANNGQEWAIINKEKAFDFLSKNDLINAYENDIIIFVRNYKSQ